MSDECIVLHLFLPCPASLAPVPPSPSERALYRSVHNCVCTVHATTCTPRTPAGAQTGSSASQVEQERAEVVVAVAIPPPVNFYPLTRDHGGGGAVEDLLGHDGGGQLVTQVVRWGSFTW